ncbi:helix-turn-helix domain-containing protein [Roseimarinus sediminis]|jgi:AraC-like DNA-binding protein|uniref:helix-turn-helix domain-containing protein n=1 Tax=Roseimarinus sediminis TaxID=1610899 RepID=UPI003D262156
MEKIFRYDTVIEYNVLNNHETFHPLVNVIDFSKANPRTWGAEANVRLNFGLYCIFLKDVKCGDLKYGRNYYDYQEGTLVFVAPGQVIEIENDGKIYQPKGHALVFHPDLLQGTNLSNGIYDYSFFSYKSHEALHVSERERQIVLDCFSKIKYELQQNIDRHSKKVITSNIELFLNYCTRFYDRQFITRENVNKGILEKFEEHLHDFFFSDRPQTIGLPSVAYFANEFNLSSNYFGDLIKRETGKSAKEYIQCKIIDIAKNKLFNKDNTVSEIANTLGFKYPQHFARMFKKETGLTPIEYRNMN